VEHHPSSYWEQPFSQPYFDNTTKRETTTTVGQSAYLHCRVRNLGDRAVSSKFPYQEPVVVITAPSSGACCISWVQIRIALNSAKQFWFCTLFLFCKIFILCIVQDRICQLSLWNIFISHFKSFLEVVNSFLLLFSRFFLFLLRR